MTRSLSCQVISHQTASYTVALLPGKPEHHQTNSCWWPAQSESQEVTSLAEPVPKDPPFLLPGRARRVSWPGDRPRARPAKKREKLKEENIPGITPKGRVLKGIVQRALLGIKTCSSRDIGAASELV